MKILKSKDFKNSDLTQLEKRILTHVKKHEPLHMGDIIKDLKLSSGKGRRKIMGLLSKGGLKYSGGATNVS